MTRAKTKSSKGSKGSKNDECAVDGGIEHKGKSEAEKKVIRVRVMIAEMGHELILLHCFGMGM